MTNNIVNSIHKIIPPFEYIYLLITLAICESAYLTIKIITLVKNKVN